MIRRTFPVLLLFAANTYGCMGRSRAGPVSGPDIVIVEPAPRVVVFREPPRLVLVESNVYVVENSGLAIYYVDGFYWHYRRGVWLHTRYWDEPWEAAQPTVVPRVIVHREHRHYVHYRGQKNAPVWRQPRERPRAKEYVRDPVAVRPRPERNARPRDDERSIRRDDERRREDEQSNVDDKKKKKKAHDDKKRRKKVHDHEK